MSVGFKNGFIKLDSFCKTYYSGQVILGSVVFELNAPLTFSALNIEYVGEAKIQVPKEPEEYEEESSIKYEGHEQYFKETQCLAGGTGVSQLPAGIREFQFAFQIPHTAPSSFKDDITYHINAYLYCAVPNKPRHIITQRFDVVAPFDLNLGSPAIKRPLELLFEVYGCDWICRVKPITVRVRLPASGYCPGQVIPISIEVQNDSSVKITKMIFQLTTRECYRSNDPVTEFVPPEELLATGKISAVPKKGKGTCQLTVPDMIVPNLDNCSIIHKAYYFKTTIRLSGCNADLQDDSEIYLGLIPLKELIEGEYVHPMAYKLPNGPIPNPNDIQNPPASLNPPSYIESIAQNSSPKPENKIGFVVPNSQLPYPMPTPVVNTPYPTNQWGVQPGCPYPINHAIQVPKNPEVEPSAPPAYS